MTRACDMYSYVTERVEILRDVNICCCIVDSHAYVVIGPNAAFLPCIDLSEIETTKRFVVTSIGSHCLWSGTGDLLERPLP